jgi:glycosyltransferase involved in cell wall biosynthesis
VLFPAFNEAATIGRLVEEARSVCIDAVDISVVVVDDGSHDDTAARAASAGARVLRHPQNRGVGAGFRTGRDAAVAAGVDYLIHMDSDGQVLPREIQRVFAPVGRGEADLALGSRFARTPAPDHMPRWQALGLRGMAGAVSVATGHPLSDISCGFRCMNQRVLGVVRPTFDYDYIQETLLQALAAGVRVVDVPVTVLYGKPHARVGMSANTIRYGCRFVGLTAYALTKFYRARRASHG